MLKSSKAKSTSYINHNQLVEWYCSILKMAQWSKKKIRGMLWPEWLVDFDLRSLKKRFELDYNIQQEFVKILVIDLYLVKIRQKVDRKGDLKEAENGSLKMVLS